MRTIRIALLSLVIIYLQSCDNTQKIRDSQELTNSETADLESIKNRYSDSLKNLKGEIKKISQDKKSVYGSRKFSESEIYDVIKNGYLDHIIIGTEDLAQSSSFFSEVLGFKVKKGKVHNSGISNIFIEFSDSSEIEIMAVDTPSDDLSTAYRKRIKEKNFGLQFAIRINKIDQLYNHFKNLNSEYVSYIENSKYSILSKNTFNERMPLFFIEHKQINFNDLTDHENRASGIRSIWLGSTELKKDILELVDFGFDLIDTVRIPAVDKKSYLMGNKNFKIKLFQSDTDRIEGVSIRMEDLSYLQKRLETEQLPFKERIVQNDKVIILSPKVTKSLYFEFIQ